MHEFICIFSECNANDNGKCKRYHTLEDLSNSYCICAVFLLGEIKEGG